MTIWNNDPIGTLTKTAKSYFIEKPFLSVMGGGIQPEVLPEYAHNRVGNGSTARNLHCFPDDQEKRGWNENELEIELYEKWEKALNRLFALENDDTDNILEFAPEAKSHLMQWQRDLTDFLNMPENDSLRPIYAKLETYSIRLSLLMEALYFACNESELKEISTRSVKASVELIKYFSKTAIKVHSELSGSDPIKALPLVKQRVFNALPEEFKTSEGYKIAFQNEMLNRSFDRFIKDESLFYKAGKGVYKKVIL